MGFSVQQACIAHPRNAFCDIALRNSVAQFRCNVQTWTTMPISSSSWGSSLTRSAVTQGAGRYE